MTTTKDPWIQRGNVVKLPLNERHDAHIKAWLKKKYYEYLAIVKAHFGA